MVLILLALAGVMSVVIYASSPKVNTSVKTSKTSLLPRESINAEGSAQFTPVTRVESGTLALIEDPSLLGLTAGAFNPKFTPLSASEQDTLNVSAQQNPELENMTAGDADNNSGISLGSALLIVLILLILF